MVREKDIESWLKTKIEAKGGLFFKFISPGQDGVPDRIAIMPDGRMIFVELKTETGVLSAQQIYQIVRLRRLGQQVCVVFGLKGARDFFDELERFVVDGGMYRGDGVVLPMVEGR